MCGSFTQPGGIRILDEFKRATGILVSPLSPAFTLMPEKERTRRPFSDVLVLFQNSSGEVMLVPMYWQLIHYWEKEFKSKYTCFNVRAESLSKPHNETLLKKQRCILPAASFFENRQVGGKRLRPREAYEFAAADGSLLLLGGIYSIWTNPVDENDCRYSCSIITTKPNQLVGEIHNRMPFIVPPDQVRPWLDAKLQDIDLLKSIIKPFAAEKMVRHRP